MGVTTDAPLIQSQMIVDEPVKLDEDEHAHDIIMAHPDVNVVEYSVLTKVISKSDCLIAEDDIHNNISYKLTLSPKMLPRLQRLKRML